MTTHPGVSPIFDFADEVVERRAKNDPLFATEAGIAGYDDQLPDFSTEQLLRVGQALRDDLDRLNGFVVDNEVDRLAVEVLRERLSIEELLATSGEARRTFCVIRSPLSAIRQAFELMTSDSVDDATTVATRLSHVRGALASWRSAVIDVADLNQLPARRHVLGLADQAMTVASGHAFEAVAERVAATTGVDVDASGLRRAAEDADRAYEELAEWLRDELSPRASADEGVGAERYRHWARYWTGATLDLSALYAWGYADLRQIRERMERVTHQLRPEATSPREVFDYLNHDPARLIHGEDALLARLKEFTATTVDELDGVHFAIDERIRFCDARLAPEGSAAAPYYINPSEDLSRPGTTWFPTLGRTSFSWWNIASMWYHEAVPGHHLQIATALLCAERQTRFHRLAGSTSGYSEGWALYAERLMDELGYFDEPGVELGFLSAQAMRAVRVVVDLGLHLALDAPEDIGELGELGDCGGRPWTPAMAVALLEDWALIDHDFAVSEVDRYLGMPAQAISYKVGERAWVDAREAAKARLGDAFSLKAFHAHALALGPLGLDTFAAELATWDGVAP